MTIAACAVVPQTLAPHHFINPKLYALRPHSDPLH